MSGYKKVTHTVYIVQWPDGIVKVGCSYVRRWRKFEKLGATVLALHDFETSTIAHDAESWGHAWLRAHGEQAFFSIAESQAHVGMDGGGHLECYRIDAEPGIEGLLGHMRLYDPGTAPKQCPCCR